MREHPQRRAAMWQRGGRGRAGAQAPCRHCPAPAPSHKMEAAAAARGGRCTCAERPPGAQTGGAAVPEPPPREVSAEGGSAVVPPLRHCGAGAFPKPVDAPLAAAPTAPPAGGRRAPPGEQPGLRAGLCGGAGGLRRPGSVCRPGRRAHPSPSAVLGLSRRWWVPLVGGGCRFPSPA